MDHIASHNQIVLDTLVSWVPDVKEAGKRVVVYGVTSKAWLAHPDVRQLLGDRVFHQSRYRVCHRPLPSPVVLAGPSSVTFTVLATGRVPNQLCRCKDAQGKPIKMEEHISDWATADRHAYTAMMCRELLDVSVFLRGAPLSAGLSRGVDPSSVSRDPLVVRDSSSTFGQSRTPHRRTTAVWAPDSNTSTSSPTTTSSPHDRQHDRHHAAQSPPPPAPPSDDSQVLLKQARQRKRG